MAHIPAPQDFYVSPQGKDTWSGRLPEPNAEQTDGPFASINHARLVIRELKRKAQLPASLTVWLRGGEYALNAPIEFTPEDSAPVTYASYPGEQATFTGGKRITNWQVEQREGHTVWVADVSHLTYFRQLFVNGERRHRARWPKVNINNARNNTPETFYRMENVPDITFQAGLFDGSHSFTAAPGDIQSWKYLTDAEVVVLHYWNEERMPIVAFDPETRLVTSSHRSIFALKDDFVNRWAKYYVDNVFEALSEPGEWYLERIPSTSGGPEKHKLHYIPLEGETPETANVIAPQITQLLKLTGNPDENQFVSFLRFENLKFEYADWVQIGETGEDPGDPTNALGLNRIPSHYKYAASAQGAYFVPGSIAFVGAEHCSIENCTVQHVGWYGIEIGAGSHGNRLVGNEIFDLGGGGIKMGGASAREPAIRRTGNNIISDNHIHKGGRVFHAGIGVLAMHADHNLIAHNHIHDFFYSGISCGWVWGYGESVSKQNRIEKNHIHDLGHAWLSDMGGVYMLGLQPDTIIRNNLIHDVEKANYGGWGLYTDEGSSGMVLENNVVYRTNSQLFHQHYGHENILRNNIFAFGDEAGLALSRVDDRLAMTFERNIMITDGSPVLAGGHSNDFSTFCMISDLNVFWSATGKPLLIGRRSRGGADVQGSFTFEQWQAQGNDIHSVVADPKLKSIDVNAFDWTLAEDSPALKLGFRPIDLSDVGPRQVDQRH